MVIVAKEKKAMFGVAGFPPAFWGSDLKNHRENIFQWLSILSLDWIELQCTYGVKMKPQQAYLYHELSEKYNIGVSIHAPYYITLASADRDVVNRSIDRIFQSFNLASIIGSERVVFHPGHFPGKSPEDRKKGLQQLIESLNSIKHDVPNGIYLYAETAGKRSQIGSIEEIIKICTEVPYVKPCIDIAHVHAFTGGTLKTEQNICDVFDLLEREMGKTVFEDMHFHMYPVEIDHTGEKRHRAFGDRIDAIQTNMFTNHDLVYYPRPEHFINAIKTKGIEPVVVCEALNSQEDGARIMKDLYYNFE